MIENLTKNVANDTTNRKGRSDKKKGQTVEEDGCGVPNEFKLVLWMLFFLCLLLVLLIVLPLFVKKPEGFIKYCKWMFTGLIGAFGAWIGAGAAYFFGKENLKLSNQSTQDALKIQQKMTKMDPSKIPLKNINLTPLNTDFIFETEATINSVEKKLGENVDYWFVPILENGKMKDVLHTEALWRYRIDKINKNSTDKLSDIIGYIDTKHNKKANKLHGFFQEFALDDTVEYALKTMNKSNASVGIVCNELGAPTHCFTRKDLRSYILGGI